MGFKIKALLTDNRTFLALLMTVVGVASFGLGRLSVAPEAAAVAVLGQQIAATPLPPPPSLEPAPLKSSLEGSGGQPVVASKSGERYHYPWCPGAAQIKEANKLTFASADLAEAAGYTRAANCPEVE